MTTFLKIPAAHCTEVSLASKTLLYIKLIRVKRPIVARLMASSLNGAVHTLLLREGLGTLKCGHVSVVSRQARLRGKIVNELSSKFNLLYYFMLCSLFVLQNNWCMYYLNCISYWNHQVGIFKCLVSALLIFEANVMYLSMNNRAFLPAYLSEFLFIKDSWEPNIMEVEGRPDLLTFNTHI